MRKRQGAPEVAKRRLSFRSTTSIFEGVRRRGKEGATPRSPIEASDEKHKEATVGKLTRESGSAVNERRSKESLGLIEWPPIA